MEDSRLKSVIVESPLLIATIDSTLQFKELSNTWARFAGLDRRGHKNLQISDLFETGSQLIVEQRAKIVLEKGENFLDLPVVVHGIDAPSEGKLAMWRANPDDHEAPVAVLSLTFETPASLVVETGGRPAIGSAPETVATKNASAIANENASELERLHQRVSCLEAEIGSRFGALVGTSNSVRRALEQIETVSKTNASVLVTGELGTGKEMIARAIHRASPGAAGPFVKLNCAVIAQDRFAVELFGTSEGVNPAPGKLWLADTGTLFLEHVSRIPLEVQVKLLQAMQLKEFERLGDGKIVPMDVRVIASNEIRLQKEVEEGRFFDDLYYRLSVFPINTAPLRKRVEDILPLTKHFIKSICRDFGRDRIIVTNQQIEQLRNLTWPGNVLELRSLLERAVLVSSGNHLRLDLVLVSDTLHLYDRGITINGGFLTETEFQALERKNIIAALRHADWRISGPGGAAELLGIKPSTLTYRMKKHRIERD